MERKRAIAKTTDEAIAEVVVELPASAEKVDRELVERSITRIRDILADTVSRGLDEVGQYLLHAFFNDDPEVYLVSSPISHASLRKLMERCESLELPVSKTYLANALRMAALTKRLPNASTFNQLPPSHRVELLRVKAPEKLERLATRAVEGKLSVIKLRTLVQKAEVRSKDAPGRGRVAAPGVFKAIESCLRQLRDESTGKLLFRRSDVGEMSEEQHARALAAFKTLEKRVADLGRILG